MYVCFSYTCIQTLTYQLPLDIKELLLILLIGQPLFSFAVVPK